jgi:hypothetical protein
MYLVSGQEMDKHTAIQALSDSLGMGIPEHLSPFGIRKNFHFTVLNMTST